MGEPGDRASKHLYSGEPTHSDPADGHDGAPKKVDLELPFPPGSKSSARPHTSRAREPGDLGGAGGFDGGPHARAGRHKPQSQQSFEESDALMVANASAFVSASEANPYAFSSAQRSLVAGKTLCIE